MNFINLFNDIQGLKAITTTVGFNACHYAGAEMQEVNKSVSMLADYFGVSANDVYIPRQTHTANVVTPEDDIESVDGLVTNDYGKIIAINTADCLPLLMADVEAHVIAAVHCGWRGTVAEIAKNAVEKMVGKGANPQRIIATMGPCICTECFEVGEEVASQFAVEAVVRSETYAKPHVDLAKAVTIQLERCGVKVDNIAQPIACSMTDERFYSVRRQGKELPYRTLTAIMLTKR